jgi:hypothetical protein
VGVTMTNQRYEVTVTFSVARTLTETELGNLLDRIQLEVAEPSQPDSDGLPSDADWSGTHMEAEVVHHGDERN